MIDYIADIFPLESSMTDSEIAIHLSARTQKPIPCDDARVALMESGAVVEDPVSGARGGDLIDHYAGLSPGEEKSLLGWFIAHCFGSGDEVSTNSLPRSVQFALVEAGLPVELEAAAGSLIALAGGRPDPLVSTADVVSLRVAHNDSVSEMARQDSISSLRAEIENTWINPAVSDGVSTETEVREAIKSGL